MSGEDLRQRRVVHYRGRVQGVGFRFTTLRTAAGFAVDGYVQNLPDGRVLVVAEGASDELDRFLAELQTEMGSHIRGADVVSAPASGEFQGFDVRY